MLDLVVMVVAVTLALTLQSVIPLTAYVVFALVRVAVLRPREVREQLGAYRRIRLRHIALAVPALVAVAGVGILTFSIPGRVGEFLAWSWLDLAGQEAGNIVVLPLTQLWLAAIYVPLLLLVLPFLAHIEERIFRWGTRSWLDGLMRSLVFGGIHALVGVPIGVAVLGLPIAGLLFTREYLLGARAAERRLEASDPAGQRPEGARQRMAWRAGIRASTTLHLAYNLVAFSLILAVLALSVLLPAV